MTTENESLLTLGIDVGGTKIDTALVDSNGNIIANYYRLVGSSKDPNKTVADIIDSVNICSNQSGKKALALGLGVAGQIDKVNGVVRYSPNLPTWRDVPLKAELENVLRIPVIINNDVRVITWGEWQHGAGKGIDDLVCLFVGTGIGGGIVSHGHLMEGCQNTAGELGHITVVAGGRKCTCPNDGCMEAYAGGWAIAERARDAVRANSQAGRALIDLAGDIASITSITVSQAFKNGDPLAQRLVKDTSKYLAAGVVSIVNAVNPCLIIMGGGVIEGLPELVSMVEARVRTQALQTPVENLSIKKGSLGTKAGVIGAAALARDHIKGRFL
jgi:glucokinase